MKSIEQIQKTLARIHKEMPLRVDVIDKKGTVLASTHAGCVGGREPQGTCRLPLRETPYVIAMEGEGPAAEHAAMLAAMLLGETAIASTKEKREIWLRSLLNGEWDGTGENTEMEDLAGYIPCRVIAIHTDTPRAESVQKMVKKVFPHPGQCLSCAMEPGTLALIVPEAGQDREDYGQLAQALLDTMENELDVDGAAGISALAGAVSDIAGAYRQARSALTAGAAKGSIRLYDDMVLERMVYSLPGDVRRSLAGRMLDREGNCLLDTEMLHTAQVFMESGLNLSETARRLYVHRNTLIYRLDKIQKMIGLDLRDFHEATVFRMLVMASNRHQEEDKT